MICKASFRRLEIGPVMARIRAACCSGCGRVVGIRPSSDRTAATMPRHVVRHLTANLARKADR